MERAELEAAMKAVSEGLCSSGSEGEQPWMNPETALPRSIDSMVIQEIPP